MQKQHVAFTTNALLVIFSAFFGILNTMDIDENSNVLF